MTLTERKTRFEMIFKLNFKTADEVVKKFNQIKDFIKHPILIKNNLNYQDISERILKQLILEDLDNFLSEFCFTNKP